ncbi:substrate-binding domain-containing protein [Leucobacter sp. CSA1]|uniref:Substrate-binding domain-containing protein n=1 Tax=Leucobacter chromiisoli TaxID=2796471 RepID=A0A934UTA8_9MICO|nr:ABC transporter substrate-binding protein [Leucobacter chromiisoli]MBK0417530.1 substrate-binding domain-containing protein [Leucobacter chromiisoli]
MNTKKWKRSAFGVAALGAAFALTLSGCSSPAANDSGDGGDGGGGDEAYEFVFVPGVAGDEFYISMGCGIQDAVEAAGGTVSEQAPEKFDPTLQKPLVDSVTSSKPDALLVAPTDVKAMEAPIKAAEAAGIKVVLVDTTLEDPSAAVSQVSSDNVGGGEAAFSAIEEAHPDGGKVLVISVDPGISTTDQRAEGFQQAAEANDKFEYLGVQYSHNEPAEAARLVTAALQKDPDIVGIFAANLFAAEGTATGVKQAGAEDITIVGFDAGPAQVKQLEDGVVQALVAQEPRKIGEEGVAQALAALNGEETEEKIQTGFTVITQDNLDGEGGDAAYVSSCG